MTATIDQTLFFMYNKVQNSSATAHFFIFCKENRHSDLLKYVKSYRWK